MTEREREILQWIAEDPFISQQDIAERAGIARSSAAVHIANLMKKGKIKGRGYIVSPEAYVTVIGAVNVDISGTSYTPILPGDSNPGRVSVSLGGVGRNIADNLSRLGAHVVMLTVLGDDVYAAKIQRSCKELGIDLSHCRMVPQEGTSTYLCINDANGDMRLAISDMEICKHITPAYLQGKLDIINRSSLVVIDANLPEETIAYLADNCTVPIFADPVSAKKAGRLKSSLKCITGIKPNRKEAEILTGIPAEDPNFLSEAAEGLHAQGVSLVFISLGADGVYYNDGLEAGILPCYASAMIDTTGCGDAFMAAAAFGFLDNFSISQLARMGLAAASICAEAPGAIHEGISIKMIQSRICEGMDTK